MYIFDNINFTYLLQKHPSIGGDVQYTLRMCAAVKRKLQVKVLNFRVCQIRA